MKKRKFISIYSLTSCEGCVVSVLLWIIRKYDFFKENFEINEVKLLSSKRKKEMDDIAIVEGAVSSVQQYEKLKKIRENAKILIAVGSCALTGFPSNNRNLFANDEEVKKYIKRFNQLDKVVAIKDVVKVDYEVPGCPLMINVLEDVLRKVVKDA